VIAVSAALQRALDDTSKRRGEEPTWTVTLTDLVQSDDIVTVNDALTVPATDLAAWATGSAIRPRVTKPSSGPSLQDITEHVASVSSPELLTFLSPGNATKPPKLSVINSVAEILAAAGIAEYRAAKQLDIAPELLAATSYLLWDSTFSDERDRRAGPDANAQKRGRITRALRDEISAAIAAKKGKK
jgi:hypothetical protein